MMIDDLYVYSNGTMRCGDVIYQCALGKCGVTEEKCEGDHKTPLGSFPLRELYIRPDRVQLFFPIGFRLTLLERSMGWCDAPDDAAYNTRVTLPYPASHELLWRDDERYDIIIPLGYNDAPAMPGKGSAIFFHLASDDYACTEGCVAVAKDDMMQLLLDIHAGTTMHILAV